MTAQDTGLWVYLNTKILCPRKPSFTRSSKAQIRSRVHAFPAIRFTDDTLTFANSLVPFKLSIGRPDLRRRLRHGFGHLGRRADFKLANLFLVLVVHIFLNSRKRCDVDYYKDDPIVFRTLGLRRLPDDSTLPDAANAPAALWVA